MLLALQLTPSRVTGLTVSCCCLLGGFLSSAFTHSTCYFINMEDSLVDDIHHTRFVILSYTHLLNAYPFSMAGFNSSPIIFFKKSTALENSNGLVNFSSLEKNEPSIYFYTSTFSFLNLLLN